MHYQIEVNDQNIDVWTREGRVEAVTLREDTQVWTQGGGGYVSQHGGWINAPQMHSRTTQYKEVRFASSDGSRSTINVDGNITCVPGDDISFVYARPSGAEQ